MLDPACGRSITVAHIRRKPTLVLFMRRNSPGDPLFLPGQVNISVTIVTGPDRPAGSGSADGSKTSDMGAKIEPVGEPASAMRRLRQGFATSTSSTLMPGSAAGVTST